jgi:hypothetical protein
MDNGVADLLSSIVSGLVGVIAGAMVSWFANVRRQRLQNTLELQREWQGESMAVVRMKADRLIRSHPGKGLLHMELQETPENYSNILRLLTFYQRLYMLVRYRQVTLALVPELFGREFAWWHVNCFRDRLPEVWIMRRDWMALHDWLQAHADPAQLRAWTEAAERARKHRDAPVEAEAELERSGDVALVAVPHSAS